MAPSVTEQYRSERRRLAQLWDAYETQVEDLDGTLRRLDALMDRLDALESVSRDLRAVIDRREQRLDALEEAIEEAEDTKHSLRDTITRREETVEDRKRRFAKLFIFAQELAEDLTTTQKELLPRDQWFTMAASRLRRASAVARTQEPYVERYITDARQPLANSETDTEVGNAIDAETATVQEESVPPEGEAVAPGTAFEPAPAMTATEEAIAAGDALADTADTAKTAGTADTDLSAVFEFDEEHEGSSAERGAALEAGPERAAPAPTLAALAALDIELPLTDKEVRALGAAGVHTLDDLIRKALADPVGRGEAALTTTRLLTVRDALIDAHAEGELRLPFQFITHRKKLEAGGGGAGAPVLFVTTANGAWTPLLGASDAEREPQRAELVYNPFFVHPAFYDPQIRTALLDAVRSAFIERLGHDADEEGIVIVHLRPLAQPVDTPTVMGVDHSVFLDRPVWETYTRLAQPGAVALSPDPLLERLEVALSEKEECEITVDREAFVDDPITWYIILAASAALRAEGRSGPLALFDLMVNATFVEQFRDRLIDIACNYPVETIEF